MKHSLLVHKAAGPALSNGKALGRRRFLRMGAAAAAGGVVGCSRRGEGPAAPPEGPRAWHLSELAPPPEWSRLDGWQGQVRGSEFRRLLETVSTDGAGFWSALELREDRALIRTSTAEEGAERYALRFAAEAGAGPAARGEGPAARYWRRAGEMGRSPGRPLEGVHIALDAGHLGGRWAQMEARWYRVGSSPAVMEGELTLQTARRLRGLLEAGGARVSLVRETAEPLTAQEPTALRGAALASLVAGQGTGVVFREEQIRREAERLFYRTSEIRARGQRVNEVLRPDLVVCLHFNAEDWGGDAGQPVFSGRNHLHVLAHGCLSGAEFSLDDQRFDTLLRLVQGVPDEEIRLCDAVARHLARATGLPAYSYLGKNARRVSDNPYVWARNLLANRVYHCPVVFTEPYVMNHAEVFARLQAGDYEGEREVAGRRGPSLFREYAQGVADGLAAALEAGRA